jgi:hypothetical protein
MDLAHLSNPGLMMQFFAFGGVAAFLAGLVKEGKLQLPCLYHQKGEDGVTRTYVDPGFLLNIVVGGIGAAILDGRPVTAIVYGIASVFIGREMLRPLVEIALKQYLPGISLSPPPPVPKPAATGTE